MSAHCFAFFLFPLYLRYLLALRYDPQWSQISPDDDPVSYRDALDAFRFAALPQLNAARAACNAQAGIDWSEVLGGLLLVESSANSHRFTVKFPSEGKHKTLAVTISKVGQELLATPHPCELASRNLGDALPSLEEDRFVQMGLMTLTEITEAKCDPADIFIPIGVLDAFMVQGTRNEEVDMHVLGPAGPHRVHFEFSGSKARLVSSDVPVCELARSPPQNAPILRAWGGISLAMSRPKRIHYIHRVQDEIYRKNKKARITSVVYSPDVPIAEARLPKYTGLLETEFHWAEVAPQCFGYGPEVQDQGSCGACWIFATLGASSDRHCLAYGRTAMSWPDGGLKRFSVQDFLSCHLVERDGCSGGFVEDGVKVLMEKRFSFEEDSPYFSKCYLADSDLDDETDDEDREDDSENCSHYSHLPDHPANDKPCTCWTSRPETHPKCNEGVERHKVQIGWGSIRAFGDLSLPKKIDFIMRYIREGGPVATAYDMWDDFKRFVNRAPDVPYFRHDPSAKWRGSHSVIITGWGVSDEGVKYWWARNSWGKNWGKKGYFKIAQGSNSVGFESQVVFPVVIEGFIDGELQLRQEADSSYATFGIRLPWSNSMVPHWGLILPEQTSADHLYRFVPSDVDPGPVRASFYPEKATVTKDVYCPEGLYAGEFELLAVEIPFICSEPCTISSSDKYEEVLPSGTITKTLRDVDHRLNDDSWSRGVLVVYIDRNDPFQGTERSQITVTVESRLFKEISAQLERDGRDISSVKDSSKIPLRSSNHTITLPAIPLHKEPDPLPEPLLPFELEVQTKPVNSPYRKYLKLEIDASEPSVYYVRVLDKETKEVLIASDVDKPPKRWAWPHIGGSMSIGGSSFKYFFFPGGAGDGRKLTIEVVATCDKFSKRIKTTAMVDFQWPKSDYNIALSILLPLWRAWDAMFGG